MRGGRGRGDRNARAETGYQGTFISWAGVTEAASGQPVSMEANKPALRYHGIPAHDDPLSRNSVDHREPPAAAVNMSRSSEARQRKKNAPRMG